jgi:hypothetical protein
MALMDFAKGRVEHLPGGSSPLSRTKATRKRQPTWQRAALQVAGSILVLIGIAIGILTLRFALVLMHGFLQ